MCSHGVQINWARLLTDLVSLRLSLVNNSRFAQAKAQAMFKLKLKDEIAWYEYSNYCL